MPRGTCLRTNYYRVPKPTSLAQQSALSEARGIVQQELLLVTTAGAKQTDPAEQETVQILTKQLEEMRQNLEALKRKTEQQEIEIIANPMERLTQVLQSDEDNRNTYSMMFAGTWVDNETPQNEHTIQDDHIVSRQTGKKRRMTYLMNATITLINDTVPRKMQEGTLNAGGNIITWTFQDAKMDPALRMVTSKWYRKPPITQAEFRQQHKEVQKVKEWHASKMSKVEDPKSIAATTWNRLKGQSRATSTKLTKGIKW